MKISAKWLTTAIVSLCLFNGLCAATSSRPTVKLSSGVTGGWLDAATGEEGVPNAQGVMSCPKGAEVWVSAPETKTDSNGRTLVFQKWSVTPAGTDLGPDFAYQSYGASFVMPKVSVTLKPEYLREDECAYLTGYASASSAWTLDGSFIEPPYDAFEWSPDGGKTWYRNEERARLKRATYTVTWRSRDPLWEAPSSKEKVYVGVANSSSSTCCGQTRISDDVTTYGYFNFVPTVSPTVRTIDHHLCSPGGGSVTMTPKDGRFLRKVNQVTLKAKANKDYVFQYWSHDSFDSGHEPFSTVAEWKIVREYGWSRSLCGSSFIAEDYIDPSDGLFHPVAVFKALSAYRAEDIVFERLGDRDIGYDEESKAFVMDLYASVGCDIGEQALTCGLEASPLTFSLSGKLPSGVKFNAKTATFSGTPTKDGEYAVTITAKDPAKNTAKLTVTIHVRKLPDWAVGDFRAMLYGGEDVWNEDEYEYEWVERPTGVVQFSVTAAGKVSLKCSFASGTRSFSGKLEWCQDEEDPSADGWYEACLGKYGDDAGFELFADGSARVWVWNDDWWDNDESHDVRRFDKKAFSASGLANRYYTFAFAGKDEKAETETGYGYLTIKTDKNGVAKLSGKLPDGNAVSISADVLTVVEGDETNAVLHVFSSPSGYKKNGYFAATLRLTEDGRVTVDDGFLRIPPPYVVKGGGCSSCCDYRGPYQPPASDNRLDGWGAFYSPASCLSNYYFTVLCKWDSRVALDYEWKDERNKKQYDAVNAQEFGGIIRTASAISST